MKIPPYWLKEQREIAGRVLRLYGSSFLSMEEARQALEQRVCGRIIWHRLMPTPLGPRYLLSPCVPLLLFPAKLSIAFL